MTKHTQGKRHNTGIEAESAAEALLKGCGYDVLNRRYRTPAGEIDIVARRDNHISFVEVKSRSSEAEAIWAISPRQQRRIAGAADYWLQAYPDIGYETITFDAVLVTHGREAQHLVDAFRPY